MDEEINTKRLYQYLNLRYVPSEETIVEGVKLDITPPRVDASQIRIEQTSGLKTKIPKLFGASVEECLSEIPLDKEIGVFISGGLDSTIMLHFLAQYPEYKINTFTMGFGEETDELEDAREVAEFYGTNHHELILGHLLIPVKVTTHNISGFKEYKVFGNDPVKVGFMRKNGCLDPLRICNAVGNFLLLSKYQVALRFNFIALRLYLLLLLADFPGTLLYLLLQLPIDFIFQFLILSQLINDAFLGHLQKPGQFKWILRYFKSIKAAYYCNKYCC